MLFVRTGTRLAKDLPEGVGDPLLSLQEAQLSRGSPQDVRTATLYAVRPAVPLGRIAS